MNSQIKWLKNIYEFNKDVEVSQSKTSTIFLFNPNPILLYLGAILDKCRRDKQNDCYQNTNLPHGEDGTI